MILIEIDVSISTTWAFTSKLLFITSAVDLLGIMTDGTVLVWDNHGD